MPIPVEDTMFGISIDGEYLTTADSSYTFTSEDLPILQQYGMTFLGYFTSDGTEYKAGDTVSQSDCGTTVSSFKLFTKWERTYVDESSGAYKPRLYNNNTDLQSILDMILALGLVDAPKPTFTIDGTEYQFEEGMTWAEWVESDYNTNAYRVYKDGIATLSHAMKGYSVGYDGTSVVSTDTIVSERAYVAGAF